MEPEKCPSVQVEANGFFLSLRPVLQGGSSVFPRGISLAVRCIEAGAWGETKSPGAGSKEDGHRSHPLVIFANSPCLHVPDFSPAAFSNEC